MQLNRYPCCRLYWIALALCLINPAIASEEPRVLTLVSVLGGINSDDGTLRSYNDIQLADGHAYVAWSSPSIFHPGGVEIYDISNPASPKQSGLCDGVSPANAIRIAGNYAYLASTTYRNRTNDTGWLEIFDVSDRARPTRLGGIETAGPAVALQVDGNFAYVAQALRWTGTNLQGAL